MADITLSNAQVLDCRKSLAQAKSTNGLTSVKLHKIRQALDAEAGPIAKAFDEIGQRCAVKADDHAPALKLGEDGQGLFWLATGTPVYEIDPAAAEAAQSELDALNAGMVTISVPQLTEQDLAWVLTTDEIGKALAPFACGVE